MNILHVTNTDPAGSVANFVRAMNTFTPHRTRLIATQRIPSFDFLNDIHDLYDGGDEVEALLKQADVIHFHKVDSDFSFEFELARGPRRFEMKDFVKGKKIVHHIHGAPSERNFVQETAEKYKSRRAIVLASTPDLEEMYLAQGVDIRYFPNCVPINDVRYLPSASDEPLTGEDGVSKRYVVFQSGTHSILKNMHLIRDVMDRVMKDLPVFFLHTSPEKIQPLDTALRHKRISHVVFDHIEGYYGLSSLEAMSMGKATIAGLNTYCKLAIANFFGIDTAHLPWVDAHDEATVEAAIRMLIIDHDKRREIGSESRKFMEEVWSDAAVAKRMAQFYQSL